MCMHAHQCSHNPDWVPPPMICMYNVHTMYNVAMNVRVHVHLQGMCIYVYLSVHAFHATVEALFLMLAQTVASETSSLVHY